MPEIVWSNELCVGVAEIDSEHQHLVEIFNQLGAAQKKGKGSRIMLEVLDKLINYTKFHFENEEQLMARAEFPGLSKHQSQHRQLIEKVQKFRQQFTANGKRITRDMMAFLNYWLTNHILVDDKAFGDYYQENGLISPPSDSKAPS